ncbi:hypothetical protein [Candidatus Uabimicrobium amorphum]|uniref:Uncharacterized protein n=1 Tax=Uabimicrobium amorphum TaxID=2596890 RepID=A0A5S9F212_UABAM|nr:hypothetical protein [Candidatus Uabimicrobium amorphum]BBM83136.1 hypothetical protein UABAM_01487 [Candidatus Uabimicrobium amorphum]
MRYFIVVTFSWIAFCGYSIYFANDLSTRSTIVFMRSFSLSTLFVVITTPILIFAKLNDKKTYLLGLGFSLLWCTVLLVTLYALKWDLSPALQKKFSPDYTSLFLVYASLFFMVFSLGYLLHRAGIICSIFLFMATTNVLWTNFFVKNWAMGKGFIINCILYSNPMIGISRCYVNSDILRTQNLYELCVIGASYPFRYPEVYEYICLYTGIGLLCLAIKIYFFVARQGKLRGVSLNKV